MNNAQLDARLRAANPVPLNYGSPERGPSQINRIGQIALAVVVAMSIGVGVAWAASGTNPFASLFPDTLKVSESDTGFGSISSLRPVTQKSLDALPIGVAELAVIRATSDTERRKRLAGQPAFGDGKGTLKPDPALISASARVETNLGTPVILLVVDDQICSFTEAGRFGPGDCSSLEAIGEGNAISWRTEEQGSRLKHVTGVFEDQVAAIDVQGDANPSIEIPGNVLELRNVGSLDITLVGLDDRGKELFRTKLE